MRDSRSGLAQPQLQFGLLAHAIVGPWRVEYQVDARSANAGYPPDGFRHRGGQAARHGTGGRGQGHSNSYFPVATDFDIVDEPEIIDVDWYFRIVHRLDRPDDPFLKSVGRGSILRYPLGSMRWCM